MPEQSLGAPLTSTLLLDGATAQIFERGILLDGSDGGGRVIVRFAFPMIGQPSIATGPASNANVLEPLAVTFQVGGWQTASLSATLQTLVQTRIGLKPTARAVVPISLSLGAPTTVKSARAGEQAVLGVPASAPLQERTLYDIVVKRDDGTWTAVAPHAVYYRTAWHNFGLAHITDIHVARRIDYFPGRLAAAGLEDVARHMANWNDRFRGFVRYANYLHEAGLLDVILATGDIVDYLYEDDDDPSGGGNPAFFRSLLLGQSPSTGMPDVEELRVPFFVTLGNHDYRKHPYRLVCDLDLSSFPGTSKRIRSYSGYKLTEQQALLADNRQTVPALSVESAGRSLEFDDAAPPFRTQLAAEGNYVVRLGSHRIVMLDSGPDTELPTSKLDLVLSQFGGVPEGKQTAIDGSPNSRGVTDAMLSRVVKELNDPPDDGLFIVGLHAPLLNMWNEEYPFFLRETQRRAQPVQSLGWIMRMAPGTSSEAEARSEHASWFGAGNEPVDFLKRGDERDLLDYGVSRGRAFELLKALAGIGQRRTAHLVLHGHIHRWAEFRLAVAANDANDIEIYTDSYTQNFARLYPTRVIGLGTPAAGLEIPSEVTYVEVSDGVPASNQPTEMPTPTAYRFMTRVPPYADPLSHAPDPRGWWARHKPLVVQTEAYGPFKEPHANLSGFRLITVKSDVIVRIDHASTETLQAHGYRIDWSALIRPDAQRARLHLQRSKEFGHPPAATDPCMAVSPANGAQAIIYRDGHGRLLELWRDASGLRGVGNLTDGAPRSAGNPSAYVDTLEKLIIVPYLGADRHVHSVYWTTGRVSHDELSRAAGAPESAGDPVGFFNEKTGLHHVVYRSASRHLQCVYWRGPERARHEDLSAASGAVEAAGDPTAWLDVRRGRNIVAYRAIDRHIRSIYWSDGPAGLDDWTGAAGSPDAASDPFGYYIDGQDVHQLYYNGVDRHIYELWCVGETRVAAGDLTAMTGAPAALGQIHGWFSAAANLKHVVYRGVDDHVHLISWVPGRAPRHVDLCIEACSPPAAGSPVGMSGARHQHVTYRGKDSHIHEILWT